MSDSQQRFTHNLDNLFQREAEKTDAHDVSGREYAAYWENPANRQRPEFTLLLWDRHFDCHGVDYPFIRRLNFEKGRITFLYDGQLVTLKGRALQNLYLRLSDHKPKHLHEFNPEYHLPVPEGVPCIEAMTIEEA